MRHYDYFRIKIDNNYQTLKIEYDDMEFVEFDVKDKNDNLVSNFNICLKNIKETKLNFKDLIDAYIRSIYINGEEIYNTNKYKLDVVFHIVNKNKCKTIKLKDLPVWVKYYFCEYCKYFS